MKLKYYIEKDNLILFASTLQDLSLELGIKLPTLKWQLRNNKCNYIKKVDYTLQILQQTGISYTINKNALVCIENTLKNDDTNERYHYK